MNMSGQKLSAPAVTTTVSSFDSPVYHQFLLVLDSLRHFCPAFLNTRFQEAKLARMIYSESTSDHVLLVSSEVWRHRDPSGYLACCDSSWHHGCGR